MTFAHDAQINVGAVSPSELRAVSEKSLLLLAGIIADMEVSCLLCSLLELRSPKCLILGI